jgi:hypothetical protein
MVDLLKNCICYCLSNPVFFFKLNKPVLFAWGHLFLKGICFCRIQGVGIGNWKLEIRSGYF